MNIKGALMFRQINAMVKREYLKWILNTKNIVILVLLVFIRKKVISPLISASIAEKTPLNCAESSLAVLNSWMCTFLLSVMFIVLISGLPRVENDFYNVVSRVGIKRWCISQLVFALCVVGTFAGVLIISSWVQTANRSFVANGWSLITTQFGQKHGTESLIPLNLYNQMPPFEALGYSVVLFLLYLILNVNFLVLGTICGKKSITTILVILLICAGEGFYLAKSKAMWFFPICHSMLVAHCQKYYRAKLFPIMGSVVILLILNVVISALIYIKMLHVNCDEMKESL